MNNMKICSIFVVTLISSSAISGTSTSDNAPLTDEQQVIAVQQDWIDAEVNHDKAVLERVLDERFVIHTSGGASGSKAEIIESVLN